MKMKLSALRNISVLALLTICFIGCDKDFTSIDSDIIDANASHFDTRQNDFNIITYNKVLDPVQTNNLPVNLLGVFNDPVYGKSTANIIAQLNASTINPTFGENVVLDSVVLTIPYFSRITEVVDQTSIFTLDSVFGNAPIKLSIFENRFFLRDFDPQSDNINEPQQYYANGSTGNGTIQPSVLEGTLITEIDEFIPSKEQIALRDVDSVITRISPALRLKLDNAFWQQKIIDKEGDPVLSNANNFLDYFRGVYFKAESIGEDGNLSILNLGSSNSNITLYFTRDSSVEGDERVGASFVLNFSGNRVNLITPLDYVIPESDPVNGDERLFLKGGQGSIGIVELFSGTDIDNSPGDNEFERFKKDFVTTDENGKFLKAKRLVNEANIVFYVDQSSVDGNEPERIYLYDLANNIPLSDFFQEVTNTTLPYLSRINHLGRLQREGDDPAGKGIKYKIRITEHINSILLRDSTNVKLGLAVSGNVNLETTLQQDVLSNDENDKVPISTLITPRSTVLYGNNTADESKKVYLEIFYTEPELNN